jgi:hypothetical protein
MTTPGIKTTRRPSVSNTSILIFSGFLVAVSPSDFVAGEAGPYVLACGLIGVLSWVGLETAGERRKQAEAAARELEAFRRLNKHLTTPLAPPLPLSLDGDPVAELLASSAERDASPRAQAVPRRNEP